MSNQPNHDIMNQNEIDRKELIEYLTWILENDGELEKFYERENFVCRLHDDDSVPDVEAFRDWLDGQDFDIMIRERYFEDYIGSHFRSTGEYNPNSSLHRYINWESFCNDLLDAEYDRVFDNEDNHPYDIFLEEFVYKY